MEDRAFNMTVMTPAPPKSIDTILEASYTRLAASITSEEQAEREQFFTGFGRPVWADEE